MSLADALVTLLEDPHSDRSQRLGALAMLGNMEPATLAQHAYAVIGRRDDSNEHEDVRAKALQTPRELKPGDARAARWRCHREARGHRR